MIRWWKHIAVFTSKLAALFVLLISSFSQNAFAAQTGCATKIQEAIEALNADTHGVLISDEEKSQIEKIFEDPHKRPFAAGYVFDLLMEKRLVLLPSQDAAQIKKVIQKAKVKPSSKLRDWLNLSSELSGWYDPKARSVTALMPESYRGSILEFFIETHEIEHAIQGLAEAKAIGKKSLNYFQRLLTGFDAQLRFVKEVGAMQAEWQYLQAIPAEIRKSIAQEIIRDTRLNKPESTAISRILLSDAWTAGEHLQLQWKTGRYTLNETQRISHSAKAVYGLKALTVTSLDATGILAAVVMIESSCLKLLNQSVMLPNGKFYQKICLRFQSIQEQQAARFQMPESLLPAERNN